MNPARALTIALVAATMASGCRDVSRFSSQGDHFRGSIITSGVVRAGIADAVDLCLVLDGDHLQDAPGMISTSDGLFAATPLRPIPQIWHDPLSTMTFGEARIQSLIYMATPTTDGGARESGIADITVVVSLMKSGNVEVRLVRGAPEFRGEIPTVPRSARPIFGVFPLVRTAGPCSF
jgi:hypothetical protein